MWKRGNIENINCRQKKYCQTYRLCLKTYAVIHLDSIFGCLRSAWTFKLNWNVFRQHSWGTYVCLNTQIYILGHKHIKFMVQSSCLNDDWTVLFYDRSVWMFKLILKHFIQPFWASQTRSFTLKWIFGTAFLGITCIFWTESKTLRKAFWPACLNRKSNFWMSHAHLNWIKKFKKIFWGALQKRSTVQNWTFGYSIWNQTLNTAFLGHQIRI